MMGNGWGMGWMWFIWPLIIILVVLVAVFLIRGAITPTRTPGHGSDAAPPREGEGGRTRAQQILDERYARGELTDEEYQQRLQHLRGDPDNPDDPDR
jgi:putative membrane protein